MRQDLASEEFLNSLEQLRIGHCTQATEQFLRSLDRPVRGDPVRIYFRKLAVDLHNLDVLNRMPGQLLTLNCKDTMNTEGIRSPAPKVLLLKPGCKIMLVWNLNRGMAPLELSYANLKMVDWR